MMCPSIQDTVSRNGERSTISPPAGHAYGSRRIDSTTPGRRIHGGRDGQMASSAWAIPRMTIDSNSVMRAANRAFIPRNHLVEGDRGGRRRWEFFGFRKAVVGGFRALRGSASVRAIRRSAAPRSGRARNVLRHLIFQGWRHDANARASGMPPRPSRSQSCVDMRAACIPPPSAQTASASSQRLGTEPRASGTPSPPRRLRSCGDMNTSWCFRRLQPRRQAHCHSVLG